MRLRSRYSSGDYRNGFEIRSCNGNYFGFAGYNAVSVVAGLTHASDRASDRYHAKARIVNSAAIELSIK